MKNLIVFLLLLGNVGVVRGQYVIDKIGIDQVNCKIVNLDHASNIKPWTDQDYVTWIFPDGQYQQEEIRLNSQGLINQGTDEVLWKPFTANHLGDKIYAYVAEKGGSGPPPQAFYTFTSFNGVVGNVAPANANFSTGKSVKINNLWDLSQGNSTMLVVSYKKNVCTSTSSDYIELKYNPNELIIENEFGFNNEQPPIVSQINSSLNSIKINTYNSSNIGVIPGNHNNYFIKVRPTTSTTLGQAITITVTSNICSVGGTPTLSTDAITCVIQDDPHDPNSKTVDIKTIYANQTDPVKLTYTVQFHNDGKAPVKKVMVTDVLPPELNPTTFKLVNMPTEMNGIITYSPQDPQLLQTSDATKIIIFESSGLPGSGLPGLGQTNPSFSYGETIYRYSFEVETYPNKRKTINNSATIVFYNDEGKQLKQVVTDVSEVLYSKENDPGMVIDCPCSSWQKFWWRFWHIFMRDKKAPCERSQKEK